MLYRLHEATRTGVFDRENRINICKYNINDEINFFYFDRIFTQDGNMVGEILRLANADREIACSPL